MSMKDKKVANEPEKKQKSFRLDMSKEANRRGLQGIAFLILLKFLGPLIGSYLIAGLLLSILFAINEFSKKNKNIADEKKQNIIQNNVYCSKCGSKNNKIAKFCFNCGQGIENNDSIMLDQLTEDTNKRTTLKYKQGLNLKDRWWHRLLSIIYIFSFIVFVVYNILYYGSHDMFEGGQTQQWEKAGSLSERITSEIKPINALIKSGEKIGENDRTYVLNDQPDEYYKGTLNDVYCSTELSSNYEKVKISRNIDVLFIRDLYDKNEVPPDLFSKYIKQNNIQCLIIDAYTIYTPNGQANGKLTFLEPDKTYQENWSFYEKSSAKTNLYFLEMILSVLAISFIIFGVIAVFYYKIIIYIIFGSKKT